MLTSKIGNMFKRLFSRKYKQTHTCMYEDRILTKWDGTSMSRYTDRGRLSSKEMRWMDVYHTTGWDIRRRGIWRIAQKQVKALFTQDQLDEHSAFNKSLSTIFKYETPQVIAGKWECLLLDHCEDNRIGYPSVVATISKEVPSTKKIKIPDLLQELDEDEREELNQELDVTISELLGIDLDNNEDNIFKSLKI